MDNNIVIVCTGTSFRSIVRRHHSEGRRSRMCRLRSCSCIFDLGTIPGQKTERTDDEYKIVNDQKEKLKNTENHKTNQNGQPKLFFWISFIMYYSLIWEKKAILQCVYTIMKHASNAQHTTSYETRTLTSNELKKKLYI